MTSVPNSEKFPISNQTNQLPMLEITAAKAFVSRLNKTGKRWCLNWSSPTGPTMERGVWWVWITFSVLLLQYSLAAAPTLNYQLPVMQWSACEHGIVPQFYSADVLFTAYWCFVIPFLILLFVTPIRSLCHSLGW